MPRAETALDPAPTGIIERWLTALGVLCAGRGDDGNAEIKLAIYAPRLMQPASVFTDANLTEAGKRFSFFPSFAELSAFLDEKAEPVKAIAWRLRQLAEAKPTAPAATPERTWSDLTPEEREAHDRMMEEVRRKIHANDVAPRPTESLAPIYVRDSSRRLGEVAGQIVESAVSRVSEEA